MNKNHRLVTETKYSLFTYQRIVLFIMLALLVLACKPEAIDKSLKSTPKLYALDDFYNAPYLKKPSFSPKGDKILISSNKSGIFNAYELSLETGELTTLTDYVTNAAYGISYFPEDERILYSLEIGADLAHIFVRNLDGTSTDVTPDSTSKAMFYKWSEDKQAFYYLCNKRDNRYFDIYKLKINHLNTKLLQSELLFENKEGYEIEGMSKDENYLVLGKVYTKNNAAIYLYERKTGKTKKIIGDSLSANYAVGVSKDEEEIFYLTEQESEFFYLKSYNFKKEKHQTITKENWDITEAHFSPQKTYRALLINEDAQTKLKLYQNNDNEQIKIPNLPCGDVSMVNFSKDEKLMCFLLNNPVCPNDLYIYSFENQELRKATDLLNPNIDRNLLAEPEFIKFPSFDGLEIPALLYKPLNIKENHQIPAIVWVHSGLGGQNRATYTPMIQYLVNQGYAVLAVNNRGSYGYGKTFSQADDGKVGEVDLKDYIAGKEFLEKTGYVKKGKIGIMGSGAYGGYIPLAALAFAPTEFAVGVDLFGVTNWYRVLKSVPSSWNSIKDLLYKELGNPITDSLTLHNKSPLFFVHQITQPLMIVQGANNPRVPKSETDQIAKELKINKIPHKYLIFNDEAHFFSKKANEIKAQKEIMKFLNTFLKGEEKQAQ
jgi:dipeptidyl aminopeptidase/acylaminoacyl peptidase